MVYTKDTQGQTVELSFSREESQAFERGFPIVDRKSYRRGIIEITVQKKQVCPNMTTQAFLRNLIHEHQVKLGQGDAACTLTVDDVVNGEKLAPEHRLRTDQGMIEADLRRFQNGVGGEVPIVEIA